MGITTLDRSAVDAYLADISANPRKYLKPGQITLLRKLVKHGVASKARNGWVMDGTFYLDKALKPFIGMDLVYLGNFPTMMMKPSPRGRGVVAKLADEKPSRKAG
jgi:hypothetical protein